MPDRGHSKVADLPQLDSTTETVNPRLREPRLVLDAECATCGPLTGEQDHSLLELALSHTADTGHVVVLNGTTDLPEDEEIEGPGASEHETSAVIAYTDGGARGNPGPSGYGVVIEDITGAKLAELKGLGRQTNNYAEYQGVIAALVYAIERGHSSLEVRSDSELVVNQIRGRYRVKNDDLRELHSRAIELIKNFA